MLLTLTTTHRPATDLGFLLGKNPARVQTFSLAFGSAHVVYGDASDDVCSVGLVVDVDALSLTRRGPGAAALQPYVNDRAYVSSSFTSVAIAQVFRSALQGTCKERPELALTALPFVVEVSVVAAAKDVVEAVFVPLGYGVDVEAVAGNAFVADGRLCRLRLTHTIRLSDLLSHLYVLLPVLDDDKHYFVGRDEVEKLLAHGAGWLEQHPAKELITRRYLKHLRFLADEALDRLDIDDADDADDADEAEAVVEGAVVVGEARVSLNERRLDRVVEVLREQGCARVIDLGCGEGKLLKRLLKQKDFSAVAGVDVSVRALQVAAERLRLDELPPKQRERLTLFQGSLTYRDARFNGYDAAVCVEVIEHMELSRLPAFSRVVFGEAAPRIVVVTTPNVEFNVKYEGLTGMRHSDHRFEWSRAEFAAFCDGVGGVYGYDVAYSGVGDVDDVFGSPTQMALFTKRAR